MMCLLLSGQRFYIYFVVGLGEENIQNQEDQLLYEESMAVAPPLVKASVSSNVMEG